MRALSFAGLLSLIGAIAFRLFVLARVPATPEEYQRMGAAAGRIGVVASAAFLLSVIAKIYLQADMMADADQSTSSMISMTISHTQWGHVWTAEVIATVVALIGFVFVRTRRQFGWWVAAVAAVALATTPALAGHAVASPDARGLAVAVDTLHVLGASAWLGSLLCVLLIGTSTEGLLRDRWERTRAIVNAFSPTALISAAVVVVTGVVSAWLRLGSVSALWTSNYGRVLLLKLAALSGVLATGAFNWLRVRPTLGTEAATLRLRRSASAELAVGCLVLVATAVLVAMPTPLDLNN